MCGQRGPEEGIPDKPYPALMGCGEVPDEVADLRDSGMGILSKPPMYSWEVLGQHRGAGHDEVYPCWEGMREQAGVMVRVPMGRRASHPSIASMGRRLGCLFLSIASLCDVDVCASGSMSAHEYEATAWPALRTASSPVAMPPQSSTMCRGREGRVYLGVSASEAG